MAVSYQQQAHDVVTVLLLDEVGLAEHSPDMPLKVCERGTSRGTSHKPRD